MVKRTAKRGGFSLLRRAASSLADALTRRGKKTAAPSAALKGNGTENKQARRTKRPTDVPLERVAEEYTPTQTSVKAGFRADGSDRQRDQDFSYNEGWNDEDHYTNRSGDPRIGTHGRTYEPGEKK